MMYRFFLNNKKWLLFLALGSLIVVTTAASIVKIKSFRKWIPRKEIRAYFQANVKPVLAAYRTDLEDELSNEEKTQVASIQAELKKLRESKKELRKILREKHKSEEEPTTEEKAELRNIMREMRKVTQNAWDIADNHSEFFDNMLAETEEDRQKWKEEIFEIVKTHKAKIQEDNKEGIQEKPERGRGFDKGHGRAHRGRMGSFGMMGPEGLTGPHAEVMFLLWNPDNPFFSEEDKAAIKDGATVFPNPAFDGSNLLYKVKSTGNVQISLHNANGEKIKTIVNGEKEAGEYNLETDISNLQEGMYFYKISTPEGNTVRRFVKE